MEHDGAPAAPVPGAPAGRKPRRDDRIEVRIDHFDARGRGIGLAGEFTVAVRHGRPGALVRARVLRRRRERIEALVEATLEPGADAAPARCAHFGTCGGCSLQDLAYAAQLAGKERLVRRALAAHGLSAAVDPVAPASAPYAYRNKMEFTFSPRRWVEAGEPEGVERGFALGLHVAGVHSRVLDVGGCPIQHPEADAILATVRAAARARGLAPWDLRTRTGLLRHLVLRRAHATGEVLVNLVTSRTADEEVLPLVRDVLDRHPAITTLVQTVTSRGAMTAVGESERVLHGPGTIRERVLGLEIALSAQSFFQTNTPQAERLYAVIAEEAEPAGRHERAWDLYSGAGSIALLLARRAGDVLGIEQVPAAVADARANAAHNGVANARFLEGDVREALDAAEVLGVPGVVVVDPPRAGLHPAVAERLAALAARRIVYVSCNPDAGARDAARLAEGGWRLARVRPIDLFPQTPHVECVLVLEREPRP